MPSCAGCGTYLKFKNVDHRVDKDGNWWCYECTIQAINDWHQIADLRNLANSVEPYRNGLLRVLPMLVDETYCVNSKSVCTPKKLKCIRCWLKYLTSENISEYDLELAIRQAREDLGNE